MVGLVAYTNWGHACHYYVRVPFVKGKNPVDWITFIFILYSFHYLFYRSFIYDRLWEIVIACLEATLINFVVVLI